MRQSLSRLGRTAVVVPGITAALILAGCKDDQGAVKGQPSDQASQSSGPAQTVTAGPPSSAAPGTPASAKTRLTITVRMSPTAKPVTRTLTCDPPGGDVPRAPDVCAALARVAAAKPDPFAPTPKGQMCTQIYGGPQVATIKGVWNGRKIDATITRTNGCEIKRWNDLAALLGPAPLDH
jgi:hypothetical protein